MALRDLGSVLRLTRQAQALPWRGWDFLATMRPGEIGGAVAEAERRLQGFVLWTPVRPADTAPSGRFAAVCDFLRGLVGRRAAKPVCVNLLDLQVCDHGAGASVEQELLESLDRDLRRTGSPVRIVVPETLLAVQVFLRGAGYVATRVLHDYFGDEDGYLMASEAWAPHADYMASQAVEAGTRAAVESA
jgi:hypothetical protein